MELYMIPIPLDQLVPAPWNPNRIDNATLDRLRTSIETFGLVQNLVVRPLDENKYEVINGNQRLKLLRDAKCSDIPCIVLALDDARARLLAQALNGLHGEDELALKAEVIRDILKTLPPNEVLAILPDSRLNLSALANLGQETLASHLKIWDQARSHRLRNLQFRLTEEQLTTVQCALNKYTGEASRQIDKNPNLRGKALYLLCKQALKEDLHGQ